MVDSRNSARVSQQDGVLKNVLTTLHSTVHDNIFPIRSHDDLRIQVDLDTWKFDILAL